MAEKRHPHTPPSAPDGEGVRVFLKPGHARPRTRLWMTLIVVLVATVLLWWMLAPGVAPIAVSTDAAAIFDQTPATAETEVLQPAAHRVSMAASVGKPQPPSNDPNDLAAYFQPGDPEPSGAEVIEALHQAGIRSGLGAFNPPGTSPPLEGLAVPDGFALPPGYVRHHQVTDEGVPIEPILMFAPDLTLYDAKGRPIKLPANGVVPPELAPPGLPLRWIRVRKQ